jgi:hypothetical protein
LKLEVAAPRSDERGRRNSCRIVPAGESTTHDEPHIEGSRITVRYIHVRVEGGGGHSPTSVAEGHGLDIADVYEALA